jgi:DNA-directed RNA polymerase specialized sigma24 family protein
LQSVTTVLGPQEFSVFVEWLDGGVDSGGRSYIDMHARLVAYFARKTCRAPEELADETLSRVARRLEEEGTIVNVVPAQYCYIVARFVLLEHLRSAERNRAPALFDVRDPGPDAAAERREQLLTGLEACLSELTADERELIVAYYAGDGASRIGARRDLATKLGLTANALTIRASRLRERLRGRLVARAKDA